MPAMPFYSRIIGSAIHDTNVSVYDEPFSELSIDDTEMSLLEMLNTLTNEVNVQHSLSMENELRGSEIIRLGMHQNEIAIQIARVLVTAEKCGEDLGTSMSYEEVITRMLKTLSMHARRMHTVLGKSNIYSPESFQLFEKLSTVYTTIRRLKTTRCALSNGSLKSKSGSEHTQPVMIRTEKQNAQSNTTPYRADPVYRVPTQQQVPQRGSYSTRISETITKAASKLETAQDKPDLGSAYLQKTVPLTLVTIPHKQTASPRSSESPNLKEGKGKDNTLKQTPTLPDPELNLDLLLSTAKKLGVTIRNLPASRSP